MNCDKCGKEGGKATHDRHGKPTVLCYKHRKKERYYWNRWMRDFRRLDKS